MLSVASNKTLRELNEARQQLEFIVKRVKNEKPLHKCPYDLHEHQNIKCPHDESVVTVKDDGPFCVVLLLAEPGSFGL